MMDLGVAQYLLAVQGTPESVTEFCRTSVEVFDAECDQPQIAALTDALLVGNLRSPPQSCRVQLF